MLVHEYENKKKMSSANKTCSIAFTLPISCQICLGKVYFQLQLLLYLTVDVFD